MNYFLLYLLFFIILFLFCGYYQHRLYKVMNAPTVCPPLDNALKSASAIGRFLNDRFMTLGGRICVPKGETGIPEHRLRNIMRGEEMAIAEFIRLCHAVGCEVVVRQIGTDDLEDPGNTPEIFAQEMSHMEDVYWKDRIS